jgi:hypothetical protein
MEPSIPYRPRVSRETRLLLTAGLLALAVLWLLSRIRFQEGPPNPVPLVLSQLSRVPAYDDLAAEIARLQSRVGPYLFVFDVPSGPFGSAESRSSVGALRLRDDFAVALLPAGSDVATVDDPRVLASDRASGLLVVRPPSAVSGYPSNAWKPGRLGEPRYLLAGEVSSQGVLIRPVFVASLDSIDSPTWSEPIWSVPARTELTPGSFVFTNSAELVGLAFSDGDGLYVVPGTALVTDADRLLGTPKAPAGTLDVEVQTLTTPVAAATGSSVGVVVTWVSPASGVSRELRTGDVIEAADGRPLPTRQHWNVRVARLSAGERLTLRVRRAGEVRDVDVVATAVAAPTPNGSLGLTLRGRAGVGAEVLRVARASAADRAGLVVGDVITLIGSVPTPTPVQVTRSFASLREGERVLVGVTRGDAHRIVTLAPWP